MTACLLAAILEVLLFDRLSVLFDVVFVAACVAAALAVRPRDFFMVGVLPPLLMLLTVLAFAIAARPVVADERDGLIQAMVSGLAHHAGALVLGYALTLGVLALRQVALRNSGTIRTTAKVRVPQQRKRPEVPVRR